ncbi:MULTISPECIES: glycosyltransferase [Trichocoleus]|uniref:Glycosyltransferase n=1 Tax=Trichocoleus desertorum GB2-A4 TaxID=2933944 RepID=A0ABV0J7B3_9CYAN|nr:glycosyltransferase [Trichocoleus sp. FACHB-46]MBD1862612.1 glycosyltransferase [Trichocoleus sp. FACHB-46]
MKILLVTPYMGEVYGGIPKIVLGIAKGLACLGVTVDVITTNASNPSKLSKPLNVWIEEGAYRVQYFPCFNKNDFIVSSSLVKWMLKNVEDYDIVHTNTLFSPLVSIIHCICKLYRIPYVMTAHGMLEPWALSYKVWKKKVYYSVVEKPALQSASTIQFSCGTEADNAKSLGLNTPTVIIYNGVHPEDFKALPETEPLFEKFPSLQNKTIVLFLGRIDPKKGLDLLAPAFAKVHRHFPQAHLIVAGPDNTGFSSTAQSYFLQAGCINAVTFTGLLTGSLKYAALAAASIYVAPSYSEGFSMSVLEGMASGLPCVITTGCNFPEAAKADAACIVDTNVDSISDALAKYLGNLEQAKELGDRARQFIFQNYTWDVAARKLLQVYTALLNQQPLPKF